MFPQSPPRSNQIQNQATDGCTSPPSAICFSAPMSADADGDSEPVTPRPWHSGSFAYVPNSPYHQPMSSPAQEIETGTQELMELHEGMPVLTNELSFKYLVNHNAIMEQMNSDDSPTGKETDNSLKIKGASVMEQMNSDDSPTRKEIDNSLKIKGASVMEQMNSDDSLTRKETDNSLKIKGASVMEQMNSDDSPTRKETDNSLKIKGSSGGHIRRKSNGPKSFLLNMLVSSGLMLRSHSLSPSQVVRQNNNHSSGISSKNVVRQERPNRLLSLLRIGASKSSEISPSNRASKVSPGPCSGKDGQPDLPLMGSPDAPRSNNSNQCAMCSAYTVFFKKKCQTCDKIYCISCAKLATVDTQKGPRCQATCAFGSNSERDLEPKVNGCWPSYPPSK